MMTKTRKVDYYKASKICKECGEPFVDTDTYRTICDNCMTEIINNCCETLSQILDDNCIEFQYQLAEDYYDNRKETKDDKRFCTDYWTLN